MAISKEEALSILNEIIFNQMDNQEEYYYKDKIKDLKDFINQAPQESPNKLEQLSYDVEVALVRLLSRANKLFKEFPHYNEFTKEQQNNELINTIKQHIQAQDKRISELEEDWKQEILDSKELRKLILVNQTKLNKIEEVVEMKYSEVLDKTPYTNISDERIVEWKYNKIKAILK